MIVKVALEWAVRLGCKEAHLPLLDWDKFYDRIKFRVVAAVLRKKGIPESVIRVIGELCEDRTARFRTAYGLSDAFSPMGGLAQECGGIELGKYMKRGRVPHPSQAVKSVG